MHLLHYVASSDKISLHVQLWYRGPVRILLDPLAYVFIEQHIDVLVVSDTVELEHLHYVVAEAATGHLLRALHKEHDIVRLNPLCKLLI